MAETELEKVTEEVEKERKRKYHMVQFTNNLEEIRKISSASVDYLTKLYPDMPEIPEWSIVVTGTFYLIKQTFHHLATRKSKGMSEVFIDFGEFARFSVEYGETIESQNDATFNPKIVVGKEMYYDNDVMSNNKLRDDQPIIDMATWEQIATAAANTIRSEGQFVVGDWRYLIYMAVAFFRQAKQFLISHRDDGDFGCVINFAEVVTFAIERFKTEDGEENIGSDRYEINMWAGKDYKITIKNNAETEHEAN